MSSKLPNYQNFQLSKLRCFESSKRAVLRNQNSALIILNFTNRIENRKVNIAESNLRINHGERVNLRDLTKLGEEETREVTENGVPGKENEFVKIVN